MADSHLVRTGLEEIFWSGFPKGHVPSQAPRELALSMETFLEDEESRSLSDLLRDPVAINHLAYRLAHPRERLDDDRIESYCELARHVLNVLIQAEE